MYNDNNGMAPGGGYFNQPGGNNASQANREAYYSNNTPSFSSSSNNNNKKIIIIIAGVVLIILILGALIFVGVKAKKRKTEALIKESIQQSYIEDSMFSADDGTVGNDFKLYRFKVRDKRVPLPLPYRTLSKLTDASLKSVYDSMNLPSKKYMSVNLYRDDKLVLFIDVYNPKDLEHKYADSDVTRVSQILSQVETYGAYKLTFPGELQVGMHMTEESIINLFGDTTHKTTKNDNGYITSTFKYVEDEENLKSNFFEVVLVNGVVTELTLDHRG